MKVRAVAAAALAGGAVLNPGEEYDIPDDLARAWTKARLVVPVETKPAEKDKPGPKEQK